MTKEWQARCKDCGAEFGYSQASYEAGMIRGHSRPERCPDCRKHHAREIQSVGMPFYKVKPLRAARIVEGVQPGLLGKIEHPPREHVVRNLPSALDTSKFGITDAKLYELFEKLQRHQIVVVVGPTGSGKSTYLPYRLMVPPVGIDPQIFTRYGQILITQPRVQAARNIPAYVAKVMHGSSIGAGFDVGFRHANTPASDWRCKLVYVTDGTLINWIVTGQISNLSVIMIDEAHERSLNIDLILGLLKKLLPRYPRLKLIVASATIDHEKFINYFGGTDQVGFVEFEGKSYGVTPHFRGNLGTAPLVYNANEVPRLARDIHIHVADQVVDLLRRMYVSGGDLHTKRGDILAFLHGVRPIEDAVRRIQQSVESTPEISSLVDVLPLYTTLPQEKQDQALGKPEWMQHLEATTGYDSLTSEQQEAAVRDALHRSRRRVVVSTNVAETSLTVHGILHVVDCGIINQDGWDDKTQTPMLAPVLHSQAGCQQRWGRAGRLMAGDAYCLYTRDQFEHVFPSYSLPQILRSPLDQVVLTAKAAGIDDLEHFPWIDPPLTSELRRATTSLQRKQALDTEGHLTAHGLELQSFSEEPILGNLMVLADRYGCAIEMATLIPMMKLGGFSRLLNRDRTWDAYTRRSVRRVHKALIGRADDDLELCLKIYAAWCESQDDHLRQDSWAFRQLWPQYVPILKQEARERLGDMMVDRLLKMARHATSPDDLHIAVQEIGLDDEVLDEWLAKVRSAFARAQPAAWARLHFVNHRTLKTRIEVEREAIIESLSGHKKEAERRTIDFDLLTRLRMIFAYGLPERIYKLSDQITDEGEPIYQPVGYVESQPVLPTVVSSTSICHRHPIKLFVCSKQQTIMRKLSADASPGSVMIASFLARVDPGWFPQILRLSPFALGQFIARESRTEDGTLRSSGARTRLMIDQQFPLGARYLCTADGTPVGERLPVHLQDRVASPPQIVEAFRSGDAALTEDMVVGEAGAELLVDTVLESADELALDPEHDQTSASLDLADDGREIADESVICGSCRATNALGSHFCRRCGSTLNTPPGERICPVCTTRNRQQSRFCRRCGQQLVETIVGPSTSGFSTSGWLTDCKDSLTSPMELRGDVIDYDVNIPECPRIVLRQTPECEPFVAFRSHFKVGDVVSVAVIEHDAYPGDPLVALVVREPTTGLETVIEPSDLTFTTRSFLTRAIPLGTQMHVLVEAIDVDTQRVRLTCRTFVNTYVQQLMAGVFEAVVYGRVAEITDRNIFFELEWGAPQQGVTVVAHARTDDLPSQGLDMSLGQRCLLRVRPPKQPRFVRLKQLPPPVEKLVQQRKWANRLNWDDIKRTLRLSGLLSNTDYQQLRECSEEDEYERAVDKLYLQCNQLEAQVVGEFRAMASIQGKNVGRLVGARWKNVRIVRDESSVIVLLDEEQGTVTIEANTSEQLHTATQRLEDLSGLRLNFVSGTRLVPRTLDESPDLLQIADIARERDGFPSGGVPRASSSDQPVLGRPPQATGKSSVTPDPVPSGGAAVYDGTGAAAKPSVSTFQVQLDGAGYFRRTYYENAIIGRQELRGAQPADAVQALAGTRLQLRFTPRNVELRVLNSATTAIINGHNLNPDSWTVLPLGISMLKLGTLNLKVTVARIDAEDK